MGLLQTDWFVARKNYGLLQQMDLMSRGFPPSYIKQIGLMSVSHVGLIKTDLFNVRKVFWIALNSMV